MKRNVNDVDRNTLHNSSKFCQSGCLQARKRVELGMKTGMGTRSDANTEPESGLGKRLNALPLSLKKFAVVQSTQLFSTFLPCIGVLV